MKKIFISLCLVLAAISVNAQSFGNHKTQKMEDWYLAIMFGVDFSEYNGENTATNESTTGLHAGVGTQLFNVSKNLGIRGELVYSQQGNKFSYGESTYYSSTSKITTGYLNLPLLAHYRHKSGFFAEAGLQPGILLSAKQKRTSSGMGGGGTTNSDIKKDMNGFDLGIPVGAGYVFKKKVAASARVTPGLLNVIKNKDAAKQTNFVFSARVSYFL